MFAAFLTWLRSFFFTRHLEIALIGLQNAGKTSLVNVLGQGEFSSEMIPTVFVLSFPASGWGLGGEGADLLKTCDRGFNLRKGVFFLMLRG